MRGGAGELGDERLLLGQLQLLLRVEEALLHADALAQVGEDADGRDLALALVDDRRGHADRHDLAARDPDLAARLLEPADAAVRRRAQHAHDLARAAAS